MRIKFINLLDKTFEVVVVFLFCLLWSRFFIDNIFISLFVCAILTLAICCLIFMLDSSKLNKKILNKEEKLKIEKVQNFLNYSKPQIIREELQNKLSAIFTDYNYALINNELFYIFCGKLSKEKIIDIIKNSSFDKFSILCSETEQDVVPFISSIKNYNINIVDAKLLFLKYNFTIEDKDCTIQFVQKTKLNLKEFFKLFIREENAKGYLITSIILMISTLIIKMKIYYYIIISLLLILAFFCKAIPKIKNSKKM